MGRGLLLLATVVGGVGSLWVAFGPVITPWKLPDVGRSTKAEVLAILGKPATVTPDDEWIYTRAANPGWVEIAFDEEDRVTAVNDESVFTWRVAQ